LKLLLPYVCTVYGGHYFQCRTKRGRKIVKEFDLAGLSEMNDELEEPDEFMSWIAPQISLNPRRFIRELIAAAPQFWAFLSAVRNPAARIDASGTLKDANMPLEVSLPPNDQSAPSAPDTQQELWRQSFTDR